MFFYDTTHLLNKHGDAKLILKYLFLVDIRFFFTKMSADMKLIEHSKWYAFVILLRNRQLSLNIRFEAGWTSSLTVTTQTNSSKMSRIGMVYVIICIQGLDSVMV